MKNTPLKRSASRPRRRAVSPASKEQRLKVATATCAFCGRPGPCDPAHLTSRAQGGCDDPLCVIPLCRLCHTWFDTGQIDMEGVLALEKWRDERGHMAWHAPFAVCQHRLRGRREAA